MSRFGPPKRQSRKSFARLPVALGVLALLAAYAALGNAPTPVQAAPKPNFVIVMADDLTVGEMPVMRRTLRRIGDAGVTFDRFYVSFPLCCPSRTSFLTGQYSHNNGMLGNGNPVGGYPALRKQDTLGVWLQAANYHTIHVGKFLNLYGRADRTDVPPGWDEWFAPVQTGSEQATAERYFDYKLNENGRVRHYGRAPADYSTDVLADKAVAAVRRRARLGTAGEPFFLYFGSLAPHLPATPAPRDRGRFGTRRMPRGVAFNERDVSDKPRFIRRLPRLTPSKVRKMERAYRKRAESLLSVDRAVARIIAELSSDGLLDNTYVLFTSDNGFFFGQHRLPKRKYLPYEPSVRLPLLMRGPDIPQGADSAELVANIDLAPTILELAAATPTVTVDGRSLMPFALDPALRTQRPILLEANSKDRDEIGIPYAGIRTSRYAYFRYRDGEVELYDMQRDPRQIRSRHGSPSYAATEQALAGYLDSLRSCSGDGCRQLGGPIPDPP